MATTITTAALDSVLDGFRADELKRLSERVSVAEEMLTRLTKAGWQPPTTAKPEEK